MIESTSPSSTLREISFNTSRSPKLFLTLVKDTSLAFSISYVEMFTIAKQIAAAKTTMVPFVAAGIFYYIFNFVVAWVMELLEKKFSYYH